MEVLNPREALLSNYEVLAFLRELEADQLARTKTALRIKKEEESSGHLIAHANEDKNENLRTIEIEAIQYLAAEYQPTASQTPEGITQLVKGLAPYDLTKAEKLQIVNLAPTEPVELYVIVEELEDRLNDQMEPILSHVRASLREPPPPVAASPVTYEVLYAEPEGDIIWEAAGTTAEMMAEDVLDEDMFDNTGEGADVEGDLDNEEE